MNIYTQTFQDIVKEFEGLAAKNSEFSDSKELQDKYLINKNVEPKEFFEGYSTYLDKLDEGVTDFRPAQLEIGDNPVADFVEGTLGSIARFGGRTAGELSDYLKLGGIKLPQEALEILDPYHGEGFLAGTEHIGGDIASFFVPFNILGKADKINKAGKFGKHIQKAFSRKPARWGAVGVVGAAHETVINNRDIDVIEDILADEDAAAALRKLETNPDDREASNLLRNFLTNLAIEGGVLGVGALGVTQLPKLYKAFKKTQTGDRVTRFGREWLTTRRGLKDTGFIRWIKRNAAAEAAYERARGVSASLENSLKKNDKKLLENFKKKHPKTVFETEDIVNEALAGNKAVLPFFSDNSKKLVLEMRENIDGLSEYLKNKFFVGELKAKVDANLNMYLNRSYRIFDDKSYSPMLMAAVKKYVKSDNYKKIIKENNKDFKVQQDLRGELTEDEIIIQDALDFLRNEFPSLPDKQIQTKLNDLIRVADKGEQAAFFDIISKSDAIFRISKSRPIKKRRKIPDPIKALWGEVKDPYTNYINTYGKLATMKAELQYMSTMNHRLERAQIHQVTDENVLRTGDYRPGADPVEPWKKSWVRLSDIAEERASIIFGGMPMGRKVSQRMVNTELNKLKHSADEVNDIIKNEFDDVSSLAAQNRIKVLQAEKKYPVGMTNRREIAKKNVEEMLDITDPQSVLNPVAEDVFVSPEYASTLRDITEPKFMEGGFGTLLRSWMVLKGLSQVTKTVYNPATHGRNTIGNMVLMMANGMNPLGGKGYSEAFKATASRISGLTDKELSAYIARTIEGNIADSSVTLGVVRDNLQKIKNDKGFVSKGARSLGQNVIARLYEGEDFFFKVAHWEKTKDYLRKAFPDKKEYPDELIEEMAFTRTRDLMPNYKLVPKALKWWSRLSPFGDFIAFPAEMARVTKNLVKYTVKDLQSGNDILKKEAYKRVGGMVGVSLFPPIAEDVTAKMFGIDEQQKQSLNHIQASFYKGSSKMFFSPIQTNSKGGKQVDVLQLGPADPFDTIRIGGLALVQSLLSGTYDKPELAKETGLTLIKRFLNPYVGPSMATDVILSLNQNPESATGYKRGKFTSGYIQKIANVLNAPTEYGTAISKIIGGVFEPGALTLLQRYKDYEEAVAKYKEQDEYTGKERTGEAYSEYMSPINFNAIPELLGVAPRPLDITGSFFNNINPHLRKMRTEDSNFNRLLQERSIPPEDYDNILEEYLRTQENKFDQQLLIKGLLEYYNDLGFTYDDWKLGMKKLEEDERITGKRKDFLKSKDFDMLSSIENNIFVPTPINEKLIKALLYNTQGRFDTDKLLELHTELLGNRLE